MRGLVVALLLGVAAGGAAFAQGSVQGSGAGPGKGPAAGSGGGAGSGGMFDVREGDPDMARAYARSRADLPGFLALVAAPPPGAAGFAVKVGFPEPGGRRTEFFWITPFERRGDRFSGRLSNTPVYARQLRQGQIVSFAEGEIVDWMYVDAEGRMRGNRTTCVAAARMPPAEREALRSRYRLSCEE